MFVGIGRLGRGHAGTLGDYALSGQGAVTKLSLIVV